VSNSLIVEPVPPTVVTEDGATEQTTQELPPAITDGLPSPTTH